LKTPLGFSFSGVHAGLKPQRKDLALVFSEQPCSAAGCFTQNKAKAAPVRVAEKRVPARDVRALLVNSGNANALTGAEGVEDVHALHAALGQALGLSEQAVLSASTGVIGVRLPTQKVLAAIPSLVKGLRPEPESAAEAIMTTDTRIKLASRSVLLGEREVTISALCKGSGMIAPQLATVIALIVTDCEISPELLQQALRAAMDTSFNSLTVDNDMSTNDTVLALANGCAKNPPVTAGSAELQKFSAALQSLCEEMAREVASDGEGATKLLEVTVTSAPSAAIAQDLARSIAGSSLVKAAIFGADPNWGRVLATVGARAGSQGYPLDPAKAKVTLQGLDVYDDKPVLEDRNALKRRMRQSEIRVVVDLRQGDAKATAWGCDLSYDYVKINADYTSLIVQTASGTVAKDDRLSHYSPAFKVNLLVEALNYIQRFKGKRCVIKYGGAAMTKESLKRSFCNDVLLLRSVGLVPIVVHGGGPEITRALERLGGNVEFVDGIRVTPASDLKVVETVLTGSVNSELVTLLNQSGAHAVGVSGKDGALLRARKLVREDGKDLGQVGEITQVNAAFLEMLLGQGYVPVISPVGLGDGGETFHLSGDAVAAAVAAAVNASKLIFLTNVPGILDGDVVLSELKTGALREKLSAGIITGGMQVKAQAILKALEGGVGQAHVLDGRTPHSSIAELFTDNGVGTLVTAE